MAGPSSAGQVVHFWAGVDLIHVMVGGARIKTVRSHLSVTDLARLVAEGAVPATGDAPLPPIEDGTAVEVERCVSRLGLVSLGNRQLLAAEILGGRRVGIRIEAATLMFFDIDTRELLRTRPNPLTMEQAGRLRGVRPAGPPPRPSSEPVTVQRRASNTGVVMVCGQKVALGRPHRYETVTIHVAETTFATEVGGETRVVRRTTTLAATSKPTGPTGPPWRVDPGRGLRCASPRCCSAGPTAPATPGPVSRDGTRPGPGARSRPAGHGRVRGRRR